jgi:hypothetical protein
LDRHFEVVRRASQRQQFRKHCDLVGRDAVVSILPASWLVRIGPQRIDQRSDPAAPVWAQTRMAPSDKTSNL